MPESTAGALQLGVDIDGDLAIDNKLGGMFGLLANESLSVGLGFEAVNARILP